MNKLLITESFKVSCMTLISRIFGMLRDIFIATFFGANSFTDVFFVSFKIPNLIRRLFLEGAFSQAFVPILSAARAKKSINEVKDIINHISGRLLLILLIVNAVGLIIAPLLILIFAYGFSGTQKFDLGVDILRITFPYLLFISLTGFAGGILNTYKKFALPAFTPTVLNITIIISIVFFRDYFQTPIFALAWGVFFGGILQLLLQIPALIKLGLLPSFKIKHHPVLSELKSRSLPIIYGGIITQTNVLVDLFLASFLVSGSISWLYYSDRLIGLPISLIGYSVATVSITTLSGLYATKQLAQFNNNLNSAFKLALIFALPATVGLVIAGKPILITIFLYGSFSLNDINSSYQSLSLYAIGIIPIIFIKIISSAFFASGDTKTVVKMNILGMFINVVLSLILVRQMQHSGLALATSIAFCVNALGLFILAIKNKIYQPNKSSIWQIMKISLATIAMIITLNLLYFNLNIWLDGDYILRIAYLSGQIICAALIYFLALFIFKIRL